MDELFAEALQADEMEGDMVRLMLDIAAQCAQDDIDTQTQALDVASKLVGRKLLKFEAIDLYENIELEHGISYQENTLVGKYLQLIPILLERSTNAELQGKKEYLVQEILKTVLEMCVFNMKERDAYSIWKAMLKGTSAMRGYVMMLLDALVEKEMAGTAVLREIFLLQGQHAGIIAPADISIPSKRGYSFAAGIFIDSMALNVALYSFRGENGYGVSAVLADDKLELSYHTTHNNQQSITVELTDLRQRMNSQWTHICIVHTKKIVFKDKIQVYIDGKLFFGGNLQYPDALNMPNGQNSIGAAPSYPTFQGKLWKPTLFGCSLSDAEVQNIHWVSTGSKSLAILAAENSSLLDKSKIIFSYDAKYTDTESNICYDVSGNSCHGWVEPGTRIVFTKNIFQSMCKIGGCSVFLLFLCGGIIGGHMNLQHALLPHEVFQILHFVVRGMRISERCRYDARTIIM